MKRNNKKKAIALIQKLQKEFPNVFPEKPLPKIPLKIGIHKDLTKKLRIAPIRIQKALQLWCLGIRYREAILNNKFRYDLDMNPVQEITEKDREHCLKKFTQKNNNLEQEETNLKI